MARSQAMASQAGVSDAEVARVTEICNRAAAGDLEARITGFDPESGLAPLFHAINRLLDVSDSYVRESTAVMTACSAGRFDRPIVRRGMPGAYDVGAVTINGAMKSMKETSDRVDALEVQRHELADQFEVRVLDSVGVVASAATEVEATAREIRVSAETSVDQVTRLDGRAVDAATAVAEGSRRCDVVVQASNEIGRVFMQIDEIASQTKLLALNASIEAARAGDAGRGFNVVATEVKNLASTTSDATQNVHVQIDALQAASGVARDSIHAISEVLGADGEPSEGRADGTQGNGQDDVRRVVSSIRSSSTGVVDAASQMGDASAELARLAESLRLDVTEFLGAVRSGV